MVKSFNAVVESSVLKISPVTSSIIMFLIVFDPEVYEFKPLNFISVHE